MLFGRKGSSFTTWSACTRHQHASKPSCKRSSRSFIKPPTDDFTLYRRPSHIPHDVERVHTTGHHRAPHPTMDFTPFPRSHAFDTMEIDQKSNSSFLIARVETHPVNEQQFRPTRAQSHSFLGLFTQTLLSNEMLI